MIRNYFKVAFRNLLRHKGFTLINLAGLAMGLTTGILIILFIIDELSFDRFHTNGDRTYRVLTKFFTPQSGAGATPMEGNGWPVGDVLRREFPEVESVVYMRSGSYLLINHEDRRIREKIQFASPDFFHIFSFPFVKGNPENALREPYSVVLTEKMANKYFPGREALGQTMTFADTLSFVVTGVMKDMPSTSHIQQDIILSFTTFEKLNQDFSYEDGWGNINMRNYVLLRPEANAESFKQRASAIYTNGAAGMLKEWGVSATVEFEPLNKIYLETKSGNGIGPTGSLERVYLVSGIAVFVLLLACINFVNLATARSVYRAREVGLRKVSGSTRMGLIRQFITESFVLTIVSFIVALLSTYFILPVFNQLMEKQYSLNSFMQLPVLAGVAVLILTISILAGAYPSWVMSSMNPVQVLKGRMQTSERGVQLRRVLVVFQFAISASLASGTLIVLSQLDYMQRRDLGFTKDEIIVLNASRARPYTELSKLTFKEKLQSLAMVDQVSINGAMPGTPGWDGQVAYPEGRSGEDAVTVQYMPVDPSYISTLDLKIVAGRDFDPTRENDLDKGLILNEAAAMSMGWNPEEAIGKKITSPSGYPAGEIIGVLKDYHHAGLQKTIGPVVMDVNIQQSPLFAIRYKASDTPELIATLEKMWKEHFPGYDFNYFFLDESFDQQYKSEQKLANVFALFAGVTVAIAAIGLLGLVSFIVVSRTKEIGIRKVLGAPMTGIVGLLSKEFVMLVVVANVVAVPIAWYFANSWLENFAYRMEVNPLLFVWTLLGALAITLLTVGYQTVVAANADPVKSLRHE